MDNYREQHQELLNRFRAALRSGDAGSWFDEDELIQIFDYAGDIGNDYLRSEVLMWGARYFPESKLLRERRAIFYNDVLDEEDVISYTQDLTEEKSTLITNLLSYKAYGIDREQAESVLSSLLQDTKSFEDEEIIQIVNFAFETSNAGWLYDNLEGLRKHTSFLPSLLFEIAALSLDNCDYEHAIPLLEELVGEAPYNIDYWDMLTKAYFAAERNDEGYEAMEMTLAIDPEYLPALQMKAHWLASQGEYKEIEKILQQYPEEQTIAELYVNAILLKHKENIIEKGSEITNLLLQYAEQFPQSDTFIDWLLIIAPEKTAPVLELIWNGLRSYATADEAATQWNEWVNELVAKHEYSGAIAILEFYFSLNDKERSSFSDKMRVTQALLYFATKQWSKTYNTIQENISITMRSCYMITVAEVMSLIKLHRYKEAHDLALFYIDSEKIYSFGENIDWTGVGQLTLVGLGVLLTDIASMTSDENVSQFDAERYDPLHFWE